MAETDHAQYRFRLKDEAPNSACIALEPHGSDLPLLALVDAHLVIYFHNGVSYEEVKRLAQELEEKVSTVACTRFKPIPPV